MGSICRSRTIVARSANSRVIFSSRSWGFAADIGLFWLLNDVFAVHHLIANPISFAVGATTVYLGSVWWVFDVRRVKNRAVEFAAFVSVGILD